MRQRKLADRWEWSSAPERPCLRLVDANGATYAAKLSNGRHILRCNETGLFTLPPSGCVIDERGYTYFVRRGAPQWRVPFTTVEGARWARAQSRWSYRARREHTAPRSRRGKPQLPIYTVARCRREVQHHHPDKGGDRRQFEIWMHRLKRAEAEPTT